MNKEYLLLRNNETYGPFTIGELLQQYLQPTDMIWVNGESCAWAFPSEIQELGLSSNGRKKLQTQKNRTSSSKQDEIEQKADALRKRVLSYSPEQITPVIIHSTHEVNETAADDDAEVEFIDHRTKELPIFEGLFAATITLFVAASVYGGYSHFAAQHQVEDLATTESVSTEDHAAKAHIVAQPSVLVSSPVTSDRALQADSVARGSVLAEQNMAAVHTTQPKSQPLKVAVPVIKDTAAVLAHMTPTKVKVEEPVPVLSTKEDSAVQTKVASVQPDSSKTEVIEKKKTLGQVLKGLFKKKKKHQDKGDTQQTETQNDD
jgi:hypothetical protein